MPAALALKMREGKLALGEVGLAEPTACMRDLGGGHFVVEINSATFELLDLVSDALFGFTTLHGPDGATPAALTHEQLVKYIANIFLDQKGGRFRTAADYRAAASGLPRPQIAEALAVHAMVFVLAHELGHVLDSASGLRAALPDPPRQWTASETYADWAGVVMTLAKWPDRMVYAGIVLAVRVYLYLERLGQRFSGPHPPLDVRFGLVKAMARSLFAHEIQFTMISTIAASYDELLEGVENYLARRDHATAQDAERVRVRLWAMLEARRNGQIDHARLVADVHDALKDVDAATAQEVASTLAQWFSPSRPASIPDPTRGRLPAMGQCLRDVIGAMPSPARQIFAQYFP